MLPSYYEFYNSAKIISGKKALDNLPYEIRFFGAERPVIVTDKGVVAAGLIDHVKNAFKSSDMTIGAIFDDVPPDSSAKVVNQIADVYRENQCDSFVAVGGGSAIDTAKGANIVISEGSTELMQFSSHDQRHRLGSHAGRGHSGYGQEHQDAFRVSEADRLGHDPGPAHDHYPAAPHHGGDRHGRADARHGGLYLHSEKSHE